MRKVKRQPKQKTKKELDKVFPGYGDLKSLSRGIITRTRENNNPSESPFDTDKEDKEGLSKIKDDEEVMTDKEFEKTLKVFDDIQWSEAGVKLADLSMSELIQIIRNISRQTFREFMIDDDPSVLTNPESVPLELPKADYEKDVQLNSSVRERKQTVRKKKRTQEADSYTTGRMKRTLNKLEDDVREAERLLKKRIKQEKDSADKAFSKDKKKNVSCKKDKAQLNEETYSRMKLLAGLS